LSDLQSITEKKQEGQEKGKGIIIRQQDQLYSFMYALKSPEARRQGPKRLKMLFDFLDLHGSLEEQAKDFLNKARKNIQWAQDSVMIFLVCIGIL
jgi:hypothetical protein